MSQPAEPLVLGGQSKERSRAHPFRLSRSHPLDRVRTLRPARPLQHRQAHREIRRHETARAAAPPRRLPEGQNGQRPRPNAASSEQRQPVLMIAIQRFRRELLPKTRVFPPGRSQQRKRLAGTGTRPLSYISTAWPLAKDSTKWLIQTTTATITIMTRGHTRPHCTRRASSSP
jgi:hypothetical protein